jgi:hypothetical protein
MPAFWHQHVFVLVDTKLAAFWHQNTSILDYSNIMMNLVLRHCSTQLHAGVVITHFQKLLKAV